MVKTNVIWAQEAANLSLIKVKAGEVIRMLKNTKEIIKLNVKHSNDFNMKILFQEYESEDQTKCPKDVVWSTEAVQVTV